MSNAGTSKLDALRQPEYTGENRCWPCTTVNSLIALGVAAVVGAGVFTLADATLALVATLTVLALSAVSIWLRGYLVPGTPGLPQGITRPPRAITKADEAQLPSGRFGHAPGTMVLVLVFR